MSIHLNENTERFARIGAIARALVGDVSLTEVTEIVVRQGMAGMDADGGILAVHDGCDTLLPAAVFGTAVDTIARIGRIPLAACFPISHAVREGVAQWVCTSDQAAEEFPALFAAAPCSQAWAAIPLEAHGRVFGSLGVSFARPHRFDADEREFLQALGDLAALALRDQWMARLVPGREGATRFVVVPDNVASALTRARSDLDVLAASMGPASPVASRLAEAASSIGWSLDQLMQLERARLALHDALARATARGEGPAAIARLCHEATGQAIVVEGREDAAAFEAGDVSAAPRRPGWRAHRDLASASLIYDGVWLTGVARLGGEIVGAVSVRAATTEDRGRYLFVVHRAVDELVKEHLRVRGSTAAELRMLGGLADALLDDEDAERACRRAANVGFDVGRPHRVVLIEVRDVDDRAILGVQRVARAMGAGTPLVTTRPGTLVLLVDAAPDWAGFLAKLRDEVPGVGRVGVGGLVERPPFARSLEEADAALRLGPGEVVSFDDLGVWGFLSVNADRGQLRRFVDRWIGPLVAYDAAHRSDLVLTLCTSLRHNLASAAIGRELHVHPNTLRYRLRRVQELTGFDLRSPEHRFNLELACRANELLRQRSG